MGGLNSGPGPGITLLIAIVLVLAQTASSAPLYEEDEGQESNSQSLAESHGCYYNFQHYNEGERILTNEPCLNCTCRNRMLMCYLRVCPFTKGIGQNCTVEKVPGQCCPIITCPEVPVQLLTSTTTEGVKIPGGHHGTKGTAVGHLDTNGCNIDGIFYPNGAQVPGSPEKPCELCYCIRNKTACIMQECALHVDGCRPVYEEGQCFPVRYQCDDSPYEEEPTTTIRPAPTPGLIITTTFAEPLDCSYNNEVYEDGSRIETEDPCEHCYCLKGKIACAVQECGAPLEKEGQNCTALPPAPGKCCPDSYQCDVTMTSQGLNHDSEGATEAGLPSVADAGHPTDGYHPDQGIRTTEKPKYTTNRLDHITETVTLSQGLGEQKPAVKPQELDKGTQNELTESHLQGLHPMKTSSISDDNQNINFPVDNNGSIKRPEDSGISEVGRPEGTHTKKPESYDHTTYSEITGTPNEEQPHTESITHILGVSTEVPEASKPIDHLQGTVAQHSDAIGIRPDFSDDQIPYRPATSNILSLKPQTSAPDTKDALLDKLHNIIQDVQAQVSDGKTTETPEQVDNETTMQSQMGHFTDKNEIVSHLPQMGSQTSMSGLPGMVNAVNGTAPDDSNDIINKLQGIIQGIYSHVTDSSISTQTPESSTLAGETQSSISTDNSGIIKPEGALESETTVSEKEGLKPHNDSAYPQKPIEINRPHDTEKVGEPEVKDKHSSEHTTEKFKPEIYSTEFPEKIGSLGDIQGIHYPGVSEGPHDSKYSTETPSGIHAEEYSHETGSTSVYGDSSGKYPKKPEGIKPESSIKLPLRPKPEGSGSDDEPYGMKYPETAEVGEEEAYTTEYPHVTDKPNLNKYPQKADKHSEKTKPAEGDADYSGGRSTTTKPFDKEKHPEEFKPDHDDFGSTTYSEQTKVTSSPLEQSHYPTKFPQSGLYPEGSKPTEKYPEGFKPQPSGQYPQVVETTEQYSDEITSSERYPDRIKTKPKPAGFVDTPIGTEYPERVTVKPDDETKYPAGGRPSGQYSEEFIPGQSNEVKPVGTYPEGSKPTGQSPESIQSSGQHPEKINLTEQYPDEYISGQHYPEGSEPIEQYPNKIKPESSVNSSLQINYPEGVIGKPDNESKYPEGTGVIPSGQYPGKIKPTDQFPNGSKQSEKAKPTEPHDDIPLVTEYPEELTGKPSVDNKYPQVSKYPVKTGQTGTEIPQSSGSESPFATKHTESSTVTSTPSNMSERPEVLRPTDEYLNPERYPGKPAESKPYSTEYPEELGVTQITKDPETLKLGRPGATDRPEISTKHSESENFRPDDQSKYPEKYQPTYKPSGIYPEGSKHPFDKNQSQGSTVSEDTPSKYEHEIQDFNRPKPGYDTEPSATEYPGGANLAPGGKPDKFDGTEVTDSLEILSKYPEKTKPEGTPYETEDLEETTSKPGAGNKHPENVKPVNEYPYGSKYPITGRPENTEKPYGSEHSEASGVTDKPEKESAEGYPEGFKPLDAKPGAEDEFYGSDYLETTVKPELSNEGTTYKYPNRSPSTQKPSSIAHPDVLKPTQPTSENFKHPQKPGAESEPYGNEFPDSTDKPDMQFTGFADVNAVTEMPDSDDYGSEYPGKVTERPVSENSYPQFSNTEYATDATNKPYELTEEDGITGRPQNKNTYSQKPGTKFPGVTHQPHEGYKPVVSPKPTAPGKPTQSKPESENELHDTEHPERPKIPGLLDSKEKQHSTEYSETVTEKPADSSKHPDEIEEIEKHFQKPESEYPNKVSTEGPTQDHPQGNTLYEHQETTKYPEESYVTQYPEKIKPPSADQLLETDAKPEDLGKYPEKTKPVTEQTEIDKLENGTKYPEKSKPSSGEGAMTRPADSSQPDVSGHPEEASFTKRPHYTTQYPQKPSDKTFGSEYSEEIDKPQYPTESEYPGKIKPVKLPGKPGSGVAPHGTEYPETEKPDKAVYNKDEIKGTDKPQDLNQYTEKSKPGSLDDSRDQTKYPTTPDFEEELFGMGATDKPEDSQKHPDSLKHPIKTKPEAENESYVTGHPKVSETDQPFDTKYSEGITDKPEHPGQHPEKITPINTENLELGNISDGGDKYSQTPGDVAFGTEYSNTETGTGKPEDSSEYPNGFKPMGQKYPQDTDHPSSFSKPEYESKYPVDFTQTGQYTQSPSGSDPEHPDNELNKKPEHHTTFPERFKPGETERPQYPESGKPYESDLSYGTESPDGRPEYHIKYPDKFRPIGIHPEVAGKPLYPTKYPDGITDRPKDHTKYPEGFKPIQKYPAKPQDSDKYLEQSKPSVSDSTYSSKDPDVGPAEKPKKPEEGFTNYPEDLTSTEHYLGATENIHGFTKYPEGSQSFSTKYPESGLTDTSDYLTEHSESIKPEEPHHEQPQVSGENSDLSSFHDTENPNIVDNEKLDISTKYSENKDRVTEYPANFGTTHEQYPFDKHLEGSKLTDSSHVTEPTYLSSIPNEYTQKFKPGYDISHSDSLTEYPLEGKPTETYPHGSERPEQSGKPPGPEQDKPFESGINVGFDTRNPDKIKPVSSEAPIQGTEYPESITDKPEVVEYFESSKDTDETETESSETITSEAPGGSKYPEEPRPTAKYPHDSIKYPQRPKPGFEHEPYGTENLETAGKPEDQTEFTTYAYESSTGKYPQRPELETTVGGNLSDDLSEYPHGFKPTSGSHLENSDITTRPHGLTNYTQKKPIVEDNTSGTQSHDEINKPEGSTRFPDNQNIEDTELPETDFKGKPQQNKYPEEFVPTGQNPEESEHSETARPNVMYSERPKPIGSYETPYSTEYPETTGSEDDIGGTEMPEYLGQYPQSPKPSGSEEKPHGTEYSEDLANLPESTSSYQGINKWPTKYPPRPESGSGDSSHGTEFPEEMSSTEKPDVENKYSDKTEHLSSRPFSERPRPIGSDQLFVTEYPTAAGKPSSSRYPEKPQLRPQDEHYDIVHSETTVKPDSEDEFHSTGDTGESDKYSQGSGSTEKPQGTEYPEAVKPDITGRPHISTKNPETIEQKVTELLGETEVTETPEDSHKGSGLYSQDSKRPHQTERPEIPEKYPDKLKPTGEYPEVSEIPNISDGESHGAGHSKITEKPENELFSTEKTENTAKPEKEKHPENLKITEKPHIIHGYPQRPKPAGLEDESSGTDYPEATEEFDETLVDQGQIAFGKYPSKPKPSTKYPEESNVTDQPTEINKYPGETEKPYNSNKYTVNLPEDGEQPYSTEYLQVTETTGQPEGAELQKPEDKINGTKVFEITKKPVSSYDIPTVEFSTKFSAHKPGIAYLPQGGELPNEKIPSSENLEENLPPEVSEHPSSAETYFGFTDVISVTGSSAEENSLSTLHHFESHQNKPPSVDLTHELGSSSPSQELITKYPQQDTTTPSHLFGSGEFPVKPIGEEAKPMKPESTKPGNGAPTSVDDYPGRPKPVVPGEGLYNAQDPNTNFVESSSIPSGTHKDDELPSKISETKRPEVSVTEKPGDEDLSSESESTEYPSRHSSTVVPSINTYPSSTHNLTGDMQYPKDISTVRPGDDYTTPGKHKTTTLKQLTDENQQSTDQPSNIDTLAEEVFSTGRPTDYTNYENYPEGISLPAEGFTRRPTQDSVSSSESVTEMPQGVYPPEKNSTEKFSSFQKTTTPSDDLINKLHDIISGIQLQVGDSKTTKLPHGGYEAISSAFPTKKPQDYYPAIDKFGRPVQKPQEFSKLPHGQSSESLTTPGRYPIDGIFSSENEVYDQTTTDVEKTAGQTEEPQFTYTSAGGSTEHSVLISKAPEGIKPSDVDDNFSTKSPHQGAAAESPHEGSKPVNLEGKPESTEFPELEIPSATKLPEFAVPTKMTSYPEQFSPTSKSPINELLVTGKPQPEEGSRPTTAEVKYPEETTVQFSHKPSTSDSVSFSQYPEGVATPASSVIPFDNSGKPDSQDENQVMTITSTGSGITGKPFDAITSRPSISQENKDKITQIYQEIKEDQKTTEGLDKLTAEENTTAPHKPITEDLLLTVTPQDVNQNHPVLISTDKPLHVVYPTYYPDGVMTRKPGGKPDGESDKKVTVTPQSTIYGFASVKNPEADSTSTPKPGVTYTVYEVHTEISSESSTTSPVVIIEEVHTEVHSERATTESDAESHFQQAITSSGVNAPELSQGKPHDYRPDHDHDKSTKQPETLPSQTPQIVFGQPATVQPVGNQSTPESQTLQPPANYPEDDKFSTLSTRAQYPVKQPESSTKPGFVTVTPIEIGLPVTKEPEHVMHLYSPKDKHPSSISSTQYPESFTTASAIYPESVKHTTRKEATIDLPETQTVFFTDPGVGTTQKSGTFGTRFPSRKTTQKPTDGVPAFQEVTTIASTEETEEHQAPHVVYSGVTRQPSFDISTEGFSAQDKISETIGFTSTEEETTQRPQGASFVPYKLINGTKVYYPEKESSERPTLESLPFDGYDHIPYEIVNGTKFFYPNRVVTSQPEYTKTTVSRPMGMYVPYKIVNGTKVYYTQDKPKKPEKFDGLDYMPFDIINGTKIFYPERVTVTPHPNLAMYVPFKIIDGTKVYYPKEAQEEPQNIPDEYDGFDYVPYDIVNGNKIFRPDHIPGHVPSTTEHLPAMYVPYKLINGNRVYYPKDAQIKPESVPEEYDGFDLVPYEVINGTKLFYPDTAAPTQKPEEVATKTPVMLVPFKIINGTKVYFPKHAQNKPANVPEGYDGFDYLPYENVNGTKIFRPEEVTPKPEFTSTPAFYSSGMFVPYKIVNNTKVFFPKDAQHKPRPLKSGYDGVQYLPYEVINGTKVFYPERVTTPIPIASSAMYIPYKLINGTKVYYADKATENPEEIPEGYEGFDYVPYEIVNGNKVFYPDRLKPTMGMYVPYKKINGSKVYYPKDSSEKHQPAPEGYDGIDYVPYEIINGTRVFYPDRATTSEPTLIMYVPYKMINGTKVYHPKDAQYKPYLVPEGYDGFDSLPYEIVNGTKVFHPENVTQRPTLTYPQGMFVPYKVINGTKIYYPQEAHKRPHPLSDEYTGLDYIPYEVVNGTKVFHPERVTPNAVSAMYVPYKLINGTKVFYPKHAQYNSQQISSEYDGFDYVPYEIINGTQVFYPNRVPNYQGMYVPYKIFNGEKVFYPKYAQYKPSEIPDGYDGFDYLPYESINGTKIFKPVETVTETPFEQAMYVPYKLINETKVLYTEYAQYKPHLIPQGFDGFDYIPYEIVNGTKVFDPKLVVPPDTPYKLAMYVPFKIINGKKVYYPKQAQDKPHLVPEGYDGFDYIPYEIVNGTKIFDPEQAFLPGTDFKPSLYVPYKIMNGIKVYQPKYAQHKPSQIPQGYDGFDRLPYDVINGNKVFYPEQSVPLKQAMYVPFKLINGTKVFYPKYAQHVPVQTPEDYDGLEYIPYEIVKGDKIFHPEQEVPTETPFRKAMYVPYKRVNGTKIYYPKNSQYIPYLIPPGYDGFDYIPYEVVNGNKIFHPEQATIPDTEPPFKQAMYVPFKVVNGTKVYYPEQAQSKPLLIPKGYDGFDYLPYEIVNGTKVFDPSVSSKPTYLEGMFVPYKLANNTKVFYPKDAHNKSNYIPEGYDGIDYVPYETLSNTKMFYPELISTVQPGKQGSAGVYVPFRIVNNKKVFHPKEATPFPLTVRYPYDGVAFVPHKILGETSPSEIIYVEDNETFKPYQTLSQSGQVPGEGSCYMNNKTFANNTEIPPVSPCQARCICISSVIRCVRVKCPLPPKNKLDCSPVYREGSCCPTYACGDSNYEYPTMVGYPGTKVPELAENASSGQEFDTSTPFSEFETQKRPSYESGNVTGGKKPEMQAPSEEYHLHKPPKPKPKPEHESLEPFDNVEGQLTPDEDYDVEDEEPYGPGTCRYAGKVYVSAQQIPRDDPCDFCFCFRSDIICLQQSCPPPIPGCRDEPIQGFCCPRYECHVKMANLINVTSTTTTTTTTLPPHFFPHAFKGSATKTGCFVQGRAYRVGQAIPSASGPCMDCICGGNGRMKCEPKVCTPEPMIRKMISPSENTTSTSNER